MGTLSRVCLSRLQAKKMTGGSGTVATPVQVACAKVGYHECTSLELMKPILARSASS